MNIRKFKNSIFLILLIWSSLLTAPVPSDIKANGQKCVSLVFDDKYSEAHKVADQLIRQYPQSTSGYFMKAAVYHYEMLDLGDKRYSNQFYSVCDQGVKLGESVKPGAAGEWDRFFMAGTLGIRGAYERSRNRLVTSLKLGWRAIEVFRPLKNEGNVDAVYGVGVYDYWVGANLKLLWWMEGATDERPRARKDLETTISNGVFTSEVVLYDLLEIYAFENNYSKLKSTALKIIKKHPSNTTAHEYLFDAEMGLKNYEGAKKLLFTRETGLRNRNAPKARFNKLSEDWKKLTKVSGLTR